MSSSSVEGVPLFFGCRTYIIRLCLSRLWRCNCKRWWSSNNKSRHYLRTDYNKQRSKKEHNNQLNSATICVYNCNGLKIQVYQTIFYLSSFEKPLSGAKYKRWTMRNNGTLGRWRGQVFYWVSFLDI